jgi:hypothetical protein
MTLEYSRPARVNTSERPSECPHRIANSFRAIGGLGNSWGLWVSLATSSAITGLEDLSPQSHSAHRRHRHVCRADHRLHATLRTVLALGVAIAIPPLAVSAPVEAQSTPRVQFIGMASMSDDGTVTLRLTMTSDGKPADAIIIYKAEDSRYDEVLRHLGGLKPRQIKPVPSWE